MYPFAPLPTHWLNLYSDCVSIGPVPGSQVCDWWTHLEAGVQGRLWRVDDEVAQREAEALGVLVEEQGPRPMPPHADALPARPAHQRWARVVTGRGEPISPPFSL